MRILLTRKLCRQLNGIDISGWSVGDVVELPRRDAELLLAEGWALPATDHNGQAQPRPEGEHAVPRTGKQRD
jgi:hypothetical protein